MQTRRGFIQAVLGATAASLPWRVGSCAGAEPRVGTGGGDLMTVLGPVPAVDAGVCLTHEHVLVDFIGAEKVSRDRYDVEEAFQAALPFLKRVRELGCRTFFECTPAYIGRDPKLLRRLAEAASLNIVTNTGYYGAGKNKYLPAHAMTESADQLAARWLREWREGIEGSGIRPGFIKIGVDAGKLSEVHRRLVEGAARTHLQSGLSIAAHTGNGEAAMDQLKVLKSEGVAPQAFVWVHAQNETDPKVLEEAARQGAWVSLDGVSPESLPRYTESLKTMRSSGLLQRVLISHDAGWYHVGEPEGGAFRPYDAIFHLLLPALRKEGFTQAELDQLLITNPRGAFGIRVRS